jgi:hypothetical protein
LHPAASRVVDTSNEYHLWAIHGPPGCAFPFGFPDGLETDTAKMPKGAVQRKFGAA